LRFDADGIFGDNTDGVGLVSDIGNAGMAVPGLDLLLIGAGGAAAGVLGPLIEALPRRIVVANRTPDRAARLIERHASLGGEHGVALLAAELDDIPGTFDLVVNATASSLSGGSVPVSASVLKPGALAYDMMYGPLARGFLDWAQRHGAVPRDGLGMLVEQAAESFRIWRGVRPPSAPVLAELRLMMDLAR
jgi:shikimate dehydrogenase